MEKNDGTLRICSRGHKYWGTGELVLESGCEEGETDPGSYFDFGAGSGWGGFISGVATSGGADDHVGVGGEINAHQAGGIPDAVIANSCN